MATPAAGSTVGLRTEALRAAAATAAVTGKQSSYFIDVTAGRAHCRPFFFAMEAFDSLALSG
jgi:hypothetical protein